MKSKYKHFALAIILAIQSFAFTVHAGEIMQIDRSQAEKEILQRVNLLNEIIRDPSAANQKNWEHYLGSPHDKANGRFYYNSISDGTLSVFEKKSSIDKKFKKRWSDSDRSELLQYLRLSLLAIYARPCKSPLTIEILEIVKRDSGMEETSPGDEEKGAPYDFFFTANGYLACDNGCIIPQKHAIQIDFQLQIWDPEYFKAPRSKDLHVYMESIRVDSHEIYGWWYHFSDCVKVTK